VEYRESEQFRKTRLCMRSFLHIPPYEKEVFLRIPPRDCFVFGPLLSRYSTHSRALKSGQSRHLARILGCRRPHAAHLRVSFLHIPLQFFLRIPPRWLIQRSSKCQEKNLLHSFALGASSSSFKAYLSFPDLFAERTDSEINVNSRHTKVPVGF
jgi:hypothetical protein